ncbi:DUF11 domain-containing protein [Jatrophihabitans telluris]|uniref:DUF11 domain-containing protein n=1 Tax=Jatrophihabitans telluris TaxID=2038343 RepID=A0ABY4QV10_9ACTN|nr:DUF11 domain-containing protein [Jatrophihabitans telluris]UQX87469.1 DUF11 domain-containing protein [Jatrophihabitans telluris]
MVGRHSAALKGAVGWNRRPLLNRTSAVLAAVSLALSGAVAWAVVDATTGAGPASAAQANCTAEPGFTDCVRLTYSGADQSFTVPDGVTTIKAKVWGAGGGAPDTDYNGASVSGSGGGGGGFATAILAVTPGQDLGVVVGQGGQPNSLTPTYGGGGAGGGSTNNAVNADPTLSRGASGGGLSGLFTGTHPAPAGALIIAGAGGGAAPGASSADQVAGGGGGDTGGQDAANASLNGRGGTQSAGGAGGTGASSTDYQCASVPAQSGSALHGGAGSSDKPTNPVGTQNNEGGGGGGAGWYGGGGGICDDAQSALVPAHDNGDGGGGSSYTGVTGVTQASTTAGGNGTNTSGTGTGGAAANPSDPQYVAGVAKGGTPGATGQAGGNGLVVLEWNRQYTVSSSVSPATTVPGGTVGYTVTITNTGDNAYAGATLASFSADLAGVLDDATYNGDATSTVAGWSFAGTTTLSGAGPLAVGQTATVSFSVTVKAPTGGDNALHDIVTATGANGSCTSAADCATTTLVRYPSFSQTKSADKASYSLGDPITYSVTVTNAGQVPGTANLADTVPATVGDVSASCASASGATCTPPADGNSVASSMTIPAGGQLVYSVNGTVIADGAVSNTATVTATSAGCTPVLCGGGAASTPARQAHSPHFVITKTADRAGYLTSDPIRYTITVTNNGAGGGSASVADTVPSTVTVTGVTCTAPGNSCNTTGSSGQSVSGTLTLTAGASASYVVAGTVAAAGSLNNTATVTPTSTGCAAQCGGGSATATASAQNRPVFTQTETADQSGYLVGQAITYTLTVGNSGLVAGTATVASQIPALVTVASVSCDAPNGSTCNTTGSSGHSLAGRVTLLPAATATYTVVGTVNGTGSLADTTTITPTTAGCSTECGGGAATTGPLSAGDIPNFTVTKTASATAYLVGEPVHYSIVVGNSGLAAGTATLSDTVPATVGSVSVGCSATGGASCSAAGPSGHTVTGGVSIPAGGSVTYSVDGVAVAAGDATNTATVSASTPGCAGQCGGGDASTAPVTIGDRPHFTQTNTADSSSYLLGQPITYTVTVANSGLGAGAVSVSDPVPATVTVTSVTCTTATGNSCDTAGSSGNTVAGAATLAAGASARYVVTGTVSASGSVASTATVTPTDAGCAHGNDCGGGTASTAALTAGSTPVFTQTKTADDSSYLVGQPITYTITVANTGGGTGLASVADSVPATVGSVSVTCGVSSGGQCNTTGSSGHTVAGAVKLPAGGSAVYTVRATVISAGSVANTATVTPTSSGCAGQCGGGTADTGPLASTDNPVFVPTNTADAAGYSVGDPITYTITIDNTGAGGGTATVDDPVTANVAVNAVTCQISGGASCDTTGSSGNSVAGSVSMPAGSAVVYTVSGTVTSAGSLVNTAIITPTTPGCASQCGGGEATTAAVSSGTDPVFAPTVSADTGSYIVGQPVNYTITVRNTGGGAGTASVADTVPAAVGSVAVTCTATGTAACDPSGSAGQNVSASVDIPAGGSVQLHVSGTVVATGTVTDSATVTPTTAGCTTQCGGGTAATPALTATPAPDLNVSTSADSATYIVGQAIVYTITVDNSAAGSGPGTAELSDVVASTVGVASVSCSATAGASCSTTGSSANSIHATMSVPAGGEVQFFVTGTVTGAGDISDTATVTPTLAGCTTQCGGGTAGTGPLSAGDQPLFTQTKVADSASYIVGQAITYTITVNNTGAGPGTATVLDTVPAAVDVSSVTCSAPDAGNGCVAGPQSNSVSGSVDLAAGTTATFTVTGFVSSAGDLANTASVTPTTGGCADQCGGGDAGTGPVPAGNHPSFTITKTADRTSYLLGQPVSYRIVVTNSGTGTGTGTITDTAPSAVSIAAVSCAAPSGSSCNTTGSSGNTLSGQVNLAVGKSATFTLTGTASSAGDAANSATITPTTAGCTTQCGGGSASTGSIPITANPVFTQSKTADSASYIVGQTVTYTVTVSNTGAGAGSASVTDPVPSTVTVTGVSCAATGGTCTTSGTSANSVSGLVTLAASGQAVYTIVGVANAAGSARNRADVTPRTAGCGSQCGGGAADTGALPIGDAPFFTQTKTTDAAAYIVGQPITYTVTVANTGSGAGTATVTDTVPGTVTVGSVTCAAAAPSACSPGPQGNSVAASVSVAAGSSVTVTISARVTSAGSVANIADVTPTTVGCAGQCGGGTAGTGVIDAAGNPVFTQTKTADSAGYILGQAITYTVTVTNTGTGPGTATVADAVPSRISVTSISCTAPSGSACATTGSSGNTLAGTVSLAAGAVSTFTVVGTVNAIGSVANTATVAATTPGCSAQCGGGDAGTGPLAATDNPVFTQTKVSDAAAYIVGQAITYTITVNNTGSGGGTASVFDEVTPTVGVTAVTCAPATGASCTSTGSGNSVRGAVSIPAGRSVVYTVIGTVLTSGSVANLVTINPNYDSTSNPNGTPGCSTQCGGGSAGTGLLLASDNPVFTQTKTANRSSYVYGQNITYFITVNNIGGGTGTATVTDTVPANVQHVMVSCDAPAPGSCVHGPQSNAVSGSITLAGGTSGSFVITGQVLGTGDVGNTATITPTTDGCNGQCGGGEASTPALPVADNPVITETKTADHSNYHVGDTIVYTITVTNAGGGVGLASVHDTVPAIVQVSQITCTTTGTAICDTTGSAANTLTGTVIASSFDSALFHITGVVTAVGDAQNIATVNADYDAVTNPAGTHGCTDQCGGGPADTGSLPVTTAADLGVGAELDGSGVVAGAPVAYAVTVTNAGPSVATNVTTIDPVPAVITAAVGTADAHIDGASCITRATTRSDLDRLGSAYGPYTLADYPVVVQCTYPSLPADSNLSETITGTANANLLPGGKVINQVVVASDTYDGVPANNRAAAIATSQTSADLVLSKTIADARIGMGGQARFTVTVTNRGPSVARSVAVTDNPSGLAPSTASWSQGSYDLASGRWDLGDLAVGQRATLSLTQIVESSTAQNTAQIVQTDTPDPQPDNNGGPRGGRVGATGLCATGTAGCGQVIVDVAGGGLAATGTPITAMSWSALGLLLGGLVLLLTGRRRRRA